jgi:hypothetical protein
VRARGAAPSAFTLLRSALLPLAAVAEEEAAGALKSFRLVPEVRRSIGLDAASEGGFALNCRCWRIFATDFGTAQTTDQTCFIYQGINLADRVKTAAD